MSQCILHCKSLSETSEQAGAAVYWKYQAGFVSVFLKEEGSNMISYFQDCISMYVANMKMSWLAAWTPEPSKSISSEPINIFSACIGQLGSFAGASFICDQSADFLMNHHLWNISWRGSGAQCIPSLLTANTPQMLSYRARTSACHMFSFWSYALIWIQQNGHLHSIQHSAILMTWTFSALPKTVGVSGGAWLVTASASAIGNQVLLRFNLPIESSAGQQTRSQDKFQNPRMWREIDCNA